MDLTTDLACSASKAVTACTCCMASSGYIHSLRFLASTPARPARPLLGSPFMTYQQARAGSLCARSTSAPKLHEVLKNVSHALLAGGDVLQFALLGAPAQVLDALTHEAQEERSG